MLEGGCWCAEKAFGWREEGGGCLSWRHMLPFFCMISFFLGDAGMIRYG